MSSCCCRVGALLLNGKWEAAARLILAVRSDDRSDIGAARAAFLERGTVFSASNQAFCSATTTPLTCTLEIAFLPPINLIRPCCFG